MKVKCCLVRCPNYCCDCKNYTEKIYHTSTLPYCIEYKKYTVEILKCDKFEKKEENFEQLTIDKLLKP